MGSYTNIDMVVRNSLKSYQIHSGGTWSPGTNGGPKILGGKGMNPNNAMYSESKWGAAFESP